MFNPYANHTNKSTFTFKIAKFAQWRLWNFQKGANDRAARLTSLATWGSSWRRLERWYLTGVGAEVSGVNPARTCRNLKRHCRRMTSIHNRLEWRPPRDWAKCAPGAGCQMSTSLGSFVKVFQGMRFSDGWFCLLVHVRFWWFIPVCSDGMVVCENFDVSVGPPAASLAPRAANR